MPKPKTFEGKSILLKNVPVDVQEAILKQLEIDTELCNGCFRTQEQAINKMLRRYNQNMEAMIALKELVRKPPSAIGYNEAYRKALEIVIKHETATRNRNGYDG